MLNGGGFFSGERLKKIKKMLISNDEHPKNVNGNFWIIRDCINLWSPSAELPSISKNTILTTDLVVNFVFFEMLATEKSAIGLSVELLKDRLGHLRWYIYSPENPEGRIFGWYETEFVGKWYMRMMSLMTQNKRIRSRDISVVDFLRARIVFWAWVRKR